MYARKIAQLADSQRQTRRVSGVLTYRRTRRRNKVSTVLRESRVPRHRTLFLIFLFAVSQYFFFNSQLFQVHEVEITGNRAVSEPDLVEALGLGSREGYLGISSDLLRERLLLLDRVQEADVELQFPGRVRAQVTERIPRYSAAYQHAPEVWYAVDGQGVVLGQKVPDKGGWRILVPRKLKSGALLSEAEQKIVTELQGRVSQSLRQRLIVIKINQRSEVALKISFKDQPLWVRLGRPEKMEYKLFLLEQLLQQLRSEATEIELIDLRHSAPVVKLKRPAKTAEAEVEDSMEAEHDETPIQEDHPTESEDLDLDWADSQPEGDEEY